VAERRGGAGRGRACSRAAGPLIAALLACALPATATAAPATGPLRVGGLTVDRLTAPADLGDTRPMLGWRLTGSGRGRAQSGYRVVVHSGRRLVWDSGRVRSNASANVRFGGPPLRSLRGYSWRVQVDDEHGRRSAWSAPARWRTGLLHAAQWHGSWIAAPPGAARAPADPPSALVPLAQGGVYLRRDFATRGPVASARVSVTALGLYELRVNGRRVSRDVLAPGWTEYARRVTSRTYDVTGLLRPGANALGAVLGEGWYAGRIFGGRRWGTSPALRAQLDVTYADGSTDRIATDRGWTAGSGCVRSAGIYDGEAFDARAEPRGWDEPGFARSDPVAAAGWQPVVTGREAAEIVPDRAPPIRVVRTIAPVAVTHPAAGTWIFDLGENVAGWARLRVRGPRGSTVRLRFGELLDAGGGLYRANLRGAAQTDAYTLRGGGEETWEPRFTYHGFRYVEVTGLAGRPPRGTIAGRVVSTALAPYGTLTTSSPLVRRLQAAIRASQRSNFLAVPTDADQRDERLGWTGDIQAFASTAAFNADVSGYLGQWLQTLRDDQAPDGAFPDTAPSTSGGVGNAGWGDAGTVVPWTLYERYGDPRVLADAYPSMLRWVDYLQQHSDGLLRPAYNYGDWLATADTPTDFVATAFFARSVQLTQRAAAVLGHTADAARLAGLHAAIRAAFVQRWIAPDGTIGWGSQTSYALALAFDLVPDEFRAAAAGHLVADVEARDEHISTGFLGTPYVLGALAGAGRTDLAYRVLEQRTYPSWGYMLTRGATSIWERWNAIAVDGELQDPSANSFNHFALGSIGDWLYGSVGGLAPDDRGPGYQRFVVRPTPGGTLTSGGATIATAYGRAADRWTTSGGRPAIAVAVPVNAVAEVHVPLAPGQTVLEGGRPAAERPGIRVAPAAARAADPGAAVFTVGSGRYRFTVR
jgi:alpha-L-rhamnosidase